MTCDILPGKLTRCSKCSLCIFRVDQCSVVEGIHVSIDFNLNKSKMIIMILLAMYNADKFSES